MKEFKEVRGFNYQPSYEATGYAIWRDFKPEVIERELGLGKKHFPGMNTVRLWLPLDAFAVDADELAQNFEALLAIVDRHELKAVPTLFNNWHAFPDFGGVTENMVRYYFRGSGKSDSASDDLMGLYLDRIVGEHAADDRILVWDLCNEPFLNDGDQELLVSWLTHTYHVCKRLGAQQPIGVSVCGYAVERVELVEAISDVLLIHPYHVANAPAPLDELIEYGRQRGKALLATECCWGSLDDQERVATVAADLGVLSERGIGFLVHALHESLVADLHRPQYGLGSNAGDMACINMDGSLRPGHEIFNQF